MIRTIIKREFLDNLLSFKFIACVLVAIIVSLASTSILTRDYQDRLRNYDKGVASAKEALTRIPVYSCLNVRLYRKPTPLSIFIAGIERKVGSYAEITNTEMDIPTALQGGVTKNDFAAIFSIFDFASVIIIIFTVLAILLSYGAISGEKEDGLLSLTLSNSVPRSKILLGKYLGALVSIAVPLAFCFIQGTLIVLLAKNVEVDTHFFPSIGLLFCVSLLYLSCILLLGILISSMTKTSFSSLLLLLAFYLVFTFLIPQAVKSFSTNTIIGRAKNVEANLETVTNEKEKKEDEAFRKAPFKKAWGMTLDHYNMQLYGGIILSRINSPEYLENQSLIWSIQIPIDREYAQKVYDLKNKDMSIEEQIRNDTQRLLAFIPSSNFGRIAVLMADTSEDSLSRYLRHVALYWHEYMRYLDEKGDFGKRLRYPGPEEQTPYEKALIKKISSDVAGLVEIKGSRTSWYEGKYLEEAENYRPKLTFLNLEDLPAFKSPEIGITERLQGSLLNMAILLFYNLLLFILAYFSFSIYDPRRMD
jgi:ABC-type transport system involved in multi-copper enzyme maturation permease subunit